MQGPLQTISKLHTFETAATYINIFPSSSLLVEPYSQRIILLKSATLFFALCCVFVLVFNYNHYSHHISPILLSIALQKPLTFFNVNGDRHKP